MRKSHIVLLVAIVLLLVGFFYFSNRAKAPVIEEVNSALATSTSPIVVVGTVNEHASSTYAEMQLSYPKSDNNSLKEVFNFVKQQKDQFLGEYGDLTDAEAASSFIRKDNPYQLFIQYKVATSSKTVTYIIQTYEYLGGAHGGTVINTFTYNADGELLTESDVFADNYLSVVAPMAKQYFYENMGEYLQPDVVDMGTAPNPENYAMWYLTDTTVVFIFGQYQVGPYVLGIQEYPILKSKIASVLQADFR